ncbi:lysozyme inhibitor LprI family protein [Orrella sp. JC864]|uniref:lysozyme inhibitor LprI family protein n=1 Tax=Orrella sp. JC864 TaxID=3120298 RepID=UPI0012BCB317
MKAGTKAMDIAAHGVAAVCVACGMALAGQAAAQDDVAQDVRQCREDPRYREIAGAMIGDCLLEISSQVDAQIERILARSAQAYCHAEDRALLAQSQQDWLAYRQGWCKLVENSPGNTQAYVNSAACMLKTGRDRLAGLVYIVDYGQPRCPVL